MVSWSKLSLSSAHGWDGTDLDQEREFVITRKLLVVDYEALPGSREGQVGGAPGHLPVVSLYILVYTDSSHSMFRYWNSTLGGRWRGVTLQWVQLWLL